MSAEWSEWERRVLDTFLQGKRIKQLPAKQKKRKVVLRWLALQVPPDTEITHANFNRILQQYYGDSATLRREMFEFGYIHRDRDHYWRDATPPDLGV